MSTLVELGFRANTTDLVTARTRMNSLTEAGGRADQSNRELTGSFTTLSKAVGVVAAGFATLGISSQVISSHARFTTAISQLSAITGATGKDLEFYKEQSLAIGAATTLTASQAAEAFKLIASAKPDLLGSATALAAVTREAVFLAEAAGVDMPIAAKALGSALNQFQLDASQAGEAVNILAASSKFGTSSINEVNDALVNVGSAANSLGVSLPDTVAGIQLLAKAGITAAEGGTGLRQVMLGLEKTGDNNLMPSIAGLSGALENLAGKQYSNTELMKLFGLEAFKSVTSILAQQKSFDSLSASIQGTDIAYEQARINNDNLEGDYKRLLSVSESLALSIGSDLNGSMRSIVQTSTGLISNIEALEDAALGFSIVIGTGIILSLGKMTAAVVAQTTADLSAVNAARASGIARATIGVSAAQAASVIAASELEIAAARVNNTKFTLSQLQAELVLERQRLASQITQTGRTQSAARLAEMQTANLAITKQLAREETLLAGATGVATGAQNSQTVAVSNLAKATGVATASMTLLGRAVTFATGGWGLLLAAVGYAAYSFITSSSDSDELTAAIKKQDDAVDELTGKYKSLSTAQLASNYQAAQKVMIGYDQKRLDLNTRLLQLESGSSRGRSTLITMVKNQIAGLDAQVAPTEAKLKSLQALLSRGVENLVPDVPATTGEEGDAPLSSASQKSYLIWLESVTGFKTPLEKVVNEISKVNSAISAGLPIAKSVAGYLSNATAEMLEFNSAAEGFDGLSASMFIDLDSNIEELNDIQGKIALIKEQSSISLIVESQGADELAVLEDQAASLEKKISAISGKDYSNFLSGLDSHEAAAQLRLAQSEMAATVQALSEGRVPKLQATTRIEELSKQIELLSSTLNQSAADDYSQWLGGLVSNSTVNQLREVTLEIQKVKASAEAGDLPEIVATERLETLNAKAKELGETLESIGNKDYSEWLKGVVSDSTITKLQLIQDEIDKTTDAMNNGLDSSIAEEHIENLKKQAKELTGILSGSDMFSAIGDSAITGLQSIQSLSEQGSSEYAKLGIAVQAVTALQAVQAVVNQAAGTNPYESFAKMAAMVSALGSLGVSVGGLSSGLSDESAENQENQGLNLYGEKAESISNSIDITANATDKLVSINTNMLSALQNLSDDIAKAVNLSIRDNDQSGLTSSVSVNENIFDNFGGTNGIIGFLSSPLESIFGDTFGGITKVFDLIFSPIGGVIGESIFNAIGGFLGGSSSTSDSGIQIAAGTLGALVTDADVDAYIETKYKTWRFGSTKRRTDYADLDDASAQFSLVFASLADTVFEGATALGLSGEAVTAAVNSFEVETLKISLKGLSADEQQAEVESVFASIFDDLALSVLPYLADFQELGEGYGETLARVATEVGIAEVLVDRLGITLGDKLADPQMFLTISSNLSSLAGGIDEFADKTASFIDSFAPDSVKLDIYTNAMVDALTGVGLALPDTTEEFFNLLQGLDATTDAGQQQVATLLNLTDTAEEYYSLLDNTVGSFNDSLQSLTASIMNTIDSMFGITYEDALTSLDDALLLARAGSFDAALGLDLSSVSASEGDFRSLADFNIAQAKTGNKLADLAALTGETMTTADYALNEAIEQTSLLKALKAGIEKGNELLKNQNRLQADSADYLDTINNKTGYA